MAEKGRYLVGQQLSDYQFEKILRSFAYGVSAKEALAQLSKGGRPTRAPNTVYRLYELTRKRLLEIGYFPDPAAYAEWTNSTVELRGTFPYSETADRIERQRDKLRGATDESVRFQLAEMIFRAENPTLAPDAIYNEIRTALRMTGPLNRKPRDADLWHERHYINVCQRHIGKLRSLRHVSRDRHRSLIEGYEVLIADAQKRLRKKLRDRSAAVSKDAAKPD